MGTPKPLTFFASPERADVETLQRQRCKLTAEPVVRAMLESFPEPAAVVNAHRQIVCANRRLESFVSRPEAILVGLRVGEAIGCEHFHETPGGCGTTPACAVCGAAAAIAATQATGQPAAEDCRITMSPDLGRESLDLRVWTTPFPFGGEQFAVFAIQDTSGEQRRRVLERMFFHDVLNAASGLRDALRLWPELDTEQMTELGPRVAPLAAQVVEEIEAQRDLVAAERGELRVARERIDVAALLDQLDRLYRHHSAADGRTLVVSSAGEGVDVVSDEVLLRRILGNLLKNALEASSRGQRVTLAFAPDDHPRFTVHNEGVMPDAVRLQVFQRSFSTKGGRGRGVGTYSARLLAERYLDGRLTFSSAAGAGTTFLLDLPPATG